jgi:membrane-associated phospholipid phosphatase
MDSVRSLLRLLRPVDALIAIFLVALTVSHLLVGAPAGDVATFAVLNAAIIAIIAGVRSVLERHGRLRVLRIVYDFYPVPTILLIFKEVHLLIQSMGRPDIDGILIAIDRAMFGTDPTVWIGRFSTPVVTEILQISYMSYFFLMLLVSIELHQRTEAEPFDVMVFTILYGFLLSYLAYMLFPAVGPRFTLHDFHALNDELPGLWLSAPIRDIINAGESIPKGAADAMALAQRDAFPSGHTQMALIAMYFAWSYRIRSRAVVMVLGTLLIVSTVYLRYHYVIDVIGGVLFMLVTIWSAPRLMRALDRLAKGS